MQSESLWLGIDIGTSFIKVSLVDDKGAIVKSITHPQIQMQIISVEQGQAEQDPQMWWIFLCQATKKLFSQSQNYSKNVKGIGITYQMHGLVLIDEKKQVLRRSIIWCDSRAVQIGKDLRNLFRQTKVNQEGQNIEELLLNSPANFTLSKLKWVQLNQSQTYKKIYKFMLPGDYIAMKLTGNVYISQTGLSECILWDFKNNKICKQALRAAQISQTLVPQIIANLSFQGKVTEEAFLKSGIPFGIPLLYRAGDQTNNAFSLGVSQKGQVAATGGTSGVIYAITDAAKSQERVKIGTFLHFNDHFPLQNHPKIGKLICMNACGSIYKWIRKQMFPHLNYAQMDEQANQVQIGSQNVLIIPFGNGSERIFDNRSLKAQFKNIEFTRHSTKHILRAALQAIAYTFVYAIQLLKKEGFAIESISVTNDNIFRSQVVYSTVSSLLKCKIKIKEKTGSVGAALAARLSYLNSQKFNQDSQKFKDSQKREGFEWKNQATLKQAILKVDFSNDQKLQQKNLIHYHRWLKQLQLLIK